MPDVKPTGTYLWRVLDRHTRTKPRSQTHHITVNAPMIPKAALMAKSLLQSGISVSDLFDLLAAVCSANATPQQAG